jgi:aminoglycoside phosphotransferase family enzyme/predicted kinase
VNPASKLPFEELVRALSDPGAFPDSPSSVECIQTHISAVFLAGGRAYKIKKPRDLGFLDFTTLDLRRHFCHEEVRLNRRLAPAVYEGVVPILREDGAVRVSEVVCESPDEEPPGEIVEWAVRMVRLPPDRTLDRLLEAGVVGAREIERLAERLADFHAGAGSGDAVSALGRWETVWRNDRENFEQIEDFVGETISAPVMERLSGLSGTELERLHGLIERRAREGVPRDTHGDLRLEHIYLLPPGTPGRSDGDPSHAGRPVNAHPDDAAEFVIIDCVEFNERMRWSDPVADVAFAVMELEYVGRADLAHHLSRRYFEAAGDPEGAELLPYYATYRNVVRGKIRSLQSADPLLPPADRDAAAAKATRHFLRGLARLSPPTDRPALVLVQGLPGVGKSTLARALAETASFQWIDTDRVRKEIAGADASSRAERGYGEGIYTAEWTARTYAECARRAREILWNGGRAAVEGSFRKEEHRLAMLRVAESLGTPFVVLSCSLDPSEARRRLAARPPGDSDADWSVHERMRAEWEAPSSATRLHVRTLSLDGPEAATVAAAHAILAREGLA